MELDLAARSFSIPRLATPRLLLRELQYADFDSFAAHNADEEVAKHLSGVIDRRTSWRHFAGASGAWAIMGAGWWAVEIRETKRMIGIVGAFFRETAFNDGDEVPPDPKNPNLELGWSIYKDFWRKGYASEAAKAAMEYGIKKHSPPRVVAYLVRENVASSRVAEKIGMKLDKEISFYGEACLRYSHRYALDV